MLGNLPLDSELLSNSAVPSIGRLDGLNDELPPLPGLPQATN